ncbi:MAG: Ig-like domain-containing protein [Aureispira sp.]
MSNVSTEITAKITEIEEQERRMRVVIGRLNDSLMIKKFSEKLKALENEKYRLRTLAEQGISLDQMVSLPPRSTSSTVTSNGTQVDTVVSGNANTSIVVNGEQIVGDSTGRTTPPITNSESSVSVDASSIEDNANASWSVAASDLTPPPISETPPVQLESIPSARLSSVESNVSTSDLTPPPISETPPRPPEPISSAKSSSGDYSNQKEEKGEVEREVEGKEGLIVKFSKPSKNQKFVSGDDVAVVIEAVSGGAIKRIKLYINDEFIRGEGAAPYEWGAANSNSAKDDAKLFNSLPPGSHTIKAVITSKSELETTEEINIIMESAKK